jgi:hypothetical protein
VTVRSKPLAVDRSTMLYPPTPDYTYAMDTPESSITLRGPTRCGPDAGAPAGARPHIDTRPRPTLAQSAIQTPPRRIRYRYRAHNAAARMAASPTLVTTRTPSRQADVSNFDHIIADALVNCAQTKLQNLGISSRVGARRSRGQPPEPRLPKIAVYR